MFKKPSLLYCDGLQLLSSPTAALPLTRPRFGAAGHRPWVTHSDRTYATASDSPDRTYLWPNTPTFTPYDVLNLKRNAPYSKGRYFELVKIYHPDRPCNEHPLCRNISPEVRLQRYHIVVSAHEILSDPDRRAAYDQFGTGWKHQPKRYNTVADSTAEWGAYGPTIYANATWEDWERWHNRHGEKQQNIVDHRTFTRLVILLTLFGVAVQASWISQLNTGYEQRLREVNEDSMRFLAGRRQHTVQQMPSNEARVQTFLIRRDPTGTGLKDEEHLVYERELSSRTGSSGMSSSDLAGDRQQGSETLGTAQLADAERSKRSRGRSDLI
jgi:curved DNA-binding protein CbpA